MAAIPVYRTWVSGEVVTAAEMNANIRDAGNFQLAKPYVDVDASGNTTLGAGTAVLISFDTENEDNDSMHSTSTNPSRIIAQTAGLFTMHWFYRVTSVSGTQTLNLRLNAAGSSTGGSSLTTTTYSGNNQIERVLRYRFQNVGDYVEMFATSTGANTASGGNRVTGATLLWEIA